MCLLGMERPAVSTSAPLSTLEMYERWAPTYPPVPHNPLMRAEQRVMLDLLPDLRERRVLDLACGSGRYARLLTERAAADVVALDFSAAMLRQVSAGHPVRASMMRLPFAAGVFDFVISGLAIGHATDIDHWMHEVARVLKGGGSLLYSDFHPDAIRSGLTRTFKDDAARAYTLHPNEYTVDIQLQAAAQAGFAVEAVREVRAGIELSETFTGSEDFYHRWHGLPLVLVIRARARSAP